MMTKNNDALVDKAYERFPDDAKARYGYLTALKEQALQPQEPSGDVGETSDGYHTFNELYEHRHNLFIALMKCYPDKSWMSKRHDDGSMYKGWFIAGIETPNGQATYHLPQKYWHICPAKVLKKAPKWDGHTPDDVIKRINSLKQSLQPRVVDVIEGLETNIANIEGNVDLGEFLQPDLDRVIDAAKAHLQSQNLLNCGWQDISTAPRDGTIFTLMKWHKDIPEFYSAWWCEEDWSLILNDDEKQEPLEGKGFGDYPNTWYWQPLPNPPKAAQEEIKRRLKLCRKEEDENA